MKKPLFINLSISIGALLICFVIGEIGIRYIGTYDEYGNFFVLGRKLKPYQLPVEATQSKIDQYLLLTSTNASTLTVVYDDLLGWAPRPNSRSENGLYSYNSSGIRSAPTEYSLSPPTGVLRIALFGDSFTHGDEVRFENTWGYYLENELREAGVQAEVINFGVPGYGMDQAYLRWKKLGHKYSPHIVIFGLQMENALRNVNTIRPIYNNGTGYPFSKPRFIVDDGDLELLNNPTIPPEEVPMIMSNIQAWHLVDYEDFYIPEEYSDQIWFKSKLIAFVEAALRGEQYNRWSRYLDSNSWSLSEEPAQLTLSIIQNFKRDVEAEGGRFIIVRLPMRQDLSTFLDGKEFQYAELLARIEKDNQIIYPERQRLQQESDINIPSIDALFTRKTGGHYTALANEVIAHEVARFMLTQQIETGDEADLNNSAPNSTENNWRKQNHERSTHLSIHRPGKQHELVGAVPGCDASGTGPARCFDAESHRKP
jgi:hypothetical protein